MGGQEGKKGLSLQREKRVSLLSQEKTLNGKESRGETKGITYRKKRKAGKGDWAWTRSHGEKQRATDKGGRVVVAPTGT